MTRLTMLCALVVASALPPDAKQIVSWEVKFLSQDAAETLQLACNRSSDQVLECMPLEAILKVQEEAIRETQESERRVREQKRAWMAHETEL